jgi:hypothetical protein
MTNNITNETKTALIDQHIYSLNANMYNIDLTVIEEEAKASPDQSRIDEVLSHKSDLLLQIAALEAHKANLE